MATKTKKSGIDFGKLQAELQGQFRNLDPKDPSLWPILPRVLLCVFIAAAVAAVLWFVKLNEYQDELHTEEAKEQTLKDDYQKKLAKAVSLDALKKQREQIQQYVLQLEKQLPSRRKCRRCFPTSIKPVWGAACNSSCSGRGRRSHVTTTPNCPLPSRSRADTTTWESLRRMSRNCRGSARSMT